MRLLTQAPASAYDGGARAFRVGSYRGRIGGADLEHARESRWVHLTREKRWVYVAIITEELVAAAAIVRLGYASKAFFYAYDANEKRFVADGSMLGPPGFANVAPVGERADGVIASYPRFGRIVRSASEASLDVKRPGFQLDARATNGPDAMTAVADVPDGIVDVTEKSVLMPAHGTLVAGERRYSLEGGFVGIDHTSGLLARHTRWRWAFAMGFDREKKPFALNLTEGFAGAAECTAWSGDALITLDEPRIQIGENGRAWRIDNDALALTLEEGARHEEKEDLKVVKSRFVQGAGIFRGTVKTGDRTIELDRVLGVVEDQDVLW